MAVDTVLVRVDTVEENTWRTILQLANASNGIGALLEAIEPILSLADRADDILALLDDGAPSEPSDG